MKKNSLDQAKQHLAQKITTALHRPSKSSAILCLIIDLPNSNPLDYYNNDFTTKIFWQGREGKTITLGLGEADTIVQKKRMNYAAVTKRMVAQFKLNPRVRYYGGICFDDSNIKEPWINFGACRFVLPRFEILQKGPRTTLTCNLIPQRDTKNKLSILKQLQAIQSFPQTQPLTSLTTRLDQPNEETWTRIVDHSLSSIMEQAYNKIVLARQSIFNFQQPHNVAQLLKYLQTMTSQCFIFAFQFDRQHAFIGATPERLYQRKGKAILTEAIAGTRPQGKNSTEGRQFVEELLTSRKDFREHQFVVEAIEQKLKKLCTKFSSDSEPKLLTFRGGYHLITQFRGQLKPALTDAKLLQQLHPTPAVAGSPTDLALKEIRTAEPFSRGWYAGPVGFWGKNETEFAVAIRSGLLNNRSLTVFAGAGIVEGSTAKNEWQEIENKIEIFRKVLNT